MEKLHEVALIQVTGGGSYDDYNSSEVIVSSISDWTMLTPDDFKHLKDWVNHSPNATYHNYRVIEKFDVNYTKICVQEAIEQEIARKAEQAKQDALKAKKRQEAALRKKAKTEAEEKALLDALKQKYKDAI